MRPVEQTLRTGDQLDARFASLRGAMTASKELSLVELAKVMESHAVPYAVIGGVAVQIWSEEPRTTLDVDIAVASYDALPREALVRAGFGFGRRFEHSENWTGPDGAPVQFSDDPAFAAAISRSIGHALAGTVLRVAPVVELIRMKLRSSKDPDRRRSRRLMDFADAVALAEQYAAALSELSAEERAALATGE